MEKAPYYKYWKTSMKISKNFTMFGYSRAAENTGFYCPELDMAFDAGVQANFVPSFICLTHLHHDHSECLYRMLIKNTKNPIIFIPDDDKFEYLLREQIKLLFCGTKFIVPDSDKFISLFHKVSFQIIRLGVGKSYLFKETKKGCGYYIEGLPSNHGVVSCSFGIYEIRQRCKEQFKNLKKNDYIEMKKNGTNFIENYQTYIFCYMSDTDIKPMIDRGQMILNYPYIFIECTFLKEEDLKQTKKKKHIHWKQLEPIINKNKKNHFILIHFSQRYTWQEINVFFSQMDIKTKPNNISIWLYPKVVVID